MELKNGIWIILIQKLKEYKVSYKFVNGNVGFLDGKKTLPHYMVMFI